MRLGPLALGSIIGVCAGSAAMAQAMPAAPAAGGPRETSFGVVLSAVHDTNPHGGQLVSAPGSSSGETTYRAAGSVSIFQPVGRQAIFLRGLVGYDFHDQDSALNSRRINLTGGAVVNASICQGALTAGYRSARSELIDVNLTSVANQQTSKSVGGNILCPIGNSLGLSVGLQDEKTTNSEPLQRTANHETQSATAAVMYGRPSLGTFGVSASYADQKIPNRINALGAVGDSFTTQSIGLTFSKKLGQKLNLTAAAGQSLIRRDIVPANVPRSRTSFTYSASGAYILNNRISLTASASKAVKPSDEAGRLYDIATTYGAAARYQLGTRFTLGAGARVSKTDSNSDSALGALAVTNSRNNSVFGSVQYRQSEKLSVTFDVRKIDRKTNVRLLNYSDTQISLSTALRF